MILGFEIWNKLCMCGFWCHSQCLLGIFRLLPSFLFNFLSYLVVSAYVLFFIRCHFNWGPLDSSIGSDPGNPWAQWQHCPGSSYERKSIEGILCRWQRSWSSSAWYWKVAFFFSILPCSWTENLLTLPVNGEAYVEFMLDAIELIGPRF